MSVGHDWPEFGAEGLRANLVFRTAKQQIDQPKCAVAETGIAEDGGDEYQYAQENERC